MFSRKAFRFCRSSARWKIETEGINGMKNHGYDLEHTFGHGQTFVAMTLAGLNLLAFAVFPSREALVETLTSFTIRPNRLKTQKIE